MLSHVQLFDPMDCSPLCSSVHGIFQSTGVGCHFLLQGIFLTQGLNPGLLHFLHWQVGATGEATHVLCVKHLALHGWEKINPTVHWQITLQKLLYILNENYVTIYIFFFLLIAKKLMSIINTLKKQFYYSFQVQLPSVFLIWFLIFFLNFNFNSLFVYNISS